MSAHRPPTSAPIDLSSNPRCLYCACCQGVFRTHSKAASRACYACAIQHGIHLRTCTQILAQDGPFDQDLTHALQVVEHILSMPAMLEALRRGEPIRHELKTWPITHNFTYPDLQACTKKWNHFVACLLGEATPTSAPNLDALYEDFQSAMQGLSNEVAAIIAETRAMNLLEDIGFLPEFMRCPQTKPVTVEAY